MPDTVEDYGSVCVFAYLCSGKKAIMKDIFRRYMVFVAGLYFLAAGVVIIVRCQLCGESQYSADIRYLHIYY